MQLLAKELSAHPIAICLACANHRNQLVPQRRAQDANSRSAPAVCQADSCTLARSFWSFFPGVCGHL